MSRLIAEQPDPPRTVPVGEIWSVFAPLVICELIGLLIVIVLGQDLSALRTWVRDAIGYAALMVLAIVLWIPLVSRVRALICNGVVATALVTGVGSFATRTRVQLHGRDMPISTGAVRGFAAGDRLKVLTNEAGDKVLLTIESAGA